MSESLLSFFEQAVLSARKISIGSTHVAGNAGLVGPSSIHEGADLGCPPLYAF
jgi:hypothetical protein